MAKHLMISQATTLSPGQCEWCGAWDRWDMTDGGTVYCECQVCIECLAYGDHEVGCDGAVDEEDGTWHEDRDRGRPWWSTSGRGSRG
jgi:hypothetical protein